MGYRARRTRHINDNLRLMLPSLLDPNTPATYLTSWLDTLGLVRDLKRAALLLPANPAWLLLTLEYPLLKMRWLEFIERWDLELLVAWTPELKDLPPRRTEPWR